MLSTSNVVFVKIGNSVSCDLFDNRITSEVGSHVLSFSGETPCTPVWEENSSAMFISPLSLESRMGSSNRTLAVFLSLTPGGLPRHGFLKNTSSTGAYGIVPRSLSLVPPGLFLLRVAFSDPELPVPGDGVSSQGVDVPSYATPGHVAESGS